MPARESVANAAMLARTTACISVSQSVLRIMQNSKSSRLQAMETFSCYYALHRSGSVVNCIPNVPVHVTGPVQIHCERGGIRPHHFEIFLLKRKSLIVTNPRLKDKKPISGNVFTSADILDLPRVQPSNFGFRCGEDATKTVKLWKKDV